MDESKEVRQIPIEDIIPNRFQPRINFDEKALNELADSIKQHGIIQPLVLRPLGDKFEIIAGERRYKAATLAGLSTVPGIVTEMDDNTSAEVALIENVQRKDLSSIEEAKSYKSMLERSNMTQEELAKKMGLSQSTIANKLRLLNLSEEVQNALSQEKISERHARALLAITNKEDQVKWLDRIIKERLTVRQLDLAIKDELNDNSDTSNADGDIPKVNINPDIDSIINNAVDIDGSAPKVEGDSNNILGDNSFVPEEESKPANKFFNYLEDEEVNMSMKEEPTNENTSAPTEFFSFTPEFQDAPENTFKPETNEEIDTLEGLDSGNKVENQVQPEVKDEPIFNENAINSEPTEELLTEPATAEPAPVEQTVVQEVQPQVEQTPVTPIVENNSPVEETLNEPVQEQPSQDVLQADMAVADTPILDASTVNSESITSETPVVQETPIVQETPAEQSPVVEQQPVAVEPAPVEQTVVQEVQPQVEQTPLTPIVENNSPVEEVKNEPVQEQPAENSVEEFIFDDEDDNTQEEQPSINIEPIPIVKGEGIVDPVEYYETLDPEFVDRVREYIGLDLKNAINSYRELTQLLNQKGFNVTIEETDLDGKYNIEVNINKE